MISAVRKARVYSERLLNEARRAAKVLEEAVYLHRSMVTVHQVLAVAIDGREPLPKGYRFGRVMEPLIEDGTVLVRRDGANIYYGIAAHQLCVLPEYQGRSNLARVEEALARAVERAGGAVTAERVKEEIEGSADLALDADALPVSNHLSNLCAWRRAKVVRPVFAGPRRKYFTTPDGPISVAASEQTELDKRRRAVRGLWKRSEGRPFTTATVRKYAAADASLRIEGDAPTGWSNALQHLENIGELIAIRQTGSRWVRWAVALDWTPLSESERAERLRDDFRCVPDDTPRTESWESVQPAGLAPNAPALDVAEVSRSANMPVILQIARATLMADELDAQDRALHARRPVTREQMLAVESHCRHLLGTVSITSALSGASRLRKGMTSTSLFNFGSVGRHTYFDVACTKDGTTFVACLRAEVELMALLKSDPIGRLQHAETLTVDETTALHPALLYARAISLGASIGGLTRYLGDFMREAPLLSTEIVRLQNLGDKGAEAVSQALAVADRARGSLHQDFALEAETSLSTDDTIQLDEAAALVASMAGYRLGSGQEFSSRLPSAGLGADLLKRVPAVAATGGRRRERVLDRVGFAGFAALRWGGPAWTTVASAGVHTMGELREFLLFVRLLNSGVPLAYQAGLLASLAIFDDTASRSAIAAYVIRAVEAEQAGDLLFPMHVLTISASGLARKYVGAKVTELTTDEHRALRMLESWRGDDAAGRTARRALASWESQDSARRFFLT